MTASALSFFGQSGVSIYEKSKKVSCSVSQIWNMSNKIFAILTDFGFDFSVASMKALILKDFPDAQIVDVDHNIAKFSVLSAAFVIEKVYRYFPSRTIFICVIDPGVGSKREPICLHTKDYTFIGPNNGLFHYILTDSNVAYEAYIIKTKFNSVHFNTFHGRDLFTPTAIEIARDNFDFLEKVDSTKLVLHPALESSTSIIVYIDTFGNIKTNIPFDDNFKWKDSLEIEINGIASSVTMANTFSKVAEGALLGYKGSNGTLEIAANLDSAGELLKAQVGNHIAIK